jgi:hypothetical protein
VPADIVTALHATGAEAVAQALDRVEGDLGPGQAGLRRALAGAVVQSASGPVRLDGHRQLIARVHLQRVGGDGRARPFRVLDGVEQTFGGAFTTTTPGPSKHSPSCRRKPAPPWAG